MGGCDWWIGGMCAYLLGDNDSSWSFLVPLNSVGRFDWDGGDVG